MKRISIVALHLIAAGSLFLISCGAPDVAKLPLTRAVMMGNTEEVKKLLAAGVQIDASDMNGVQAIHRAAQYSNPEVLKVLIAAGARVDAADKAGTEPIIYAVNGDKSESVKVLLAAGAKVDAWDKNGRQSIHLATYTDHIELAKTLLAAGAKADAVDKNGDRPLHWAARHGNQEMARVLLAAGAKVDAVDKNGDQPLHWAARYGNYGNTEIVKVLLAAGAKMDEPNKNGDSPNAIAKHIGPSEKDTGNMKGSLDEATINYLKNNLDPIFIRAGLCNSSNDCLGKDIIFCSQTNSLSCGIYGIPNENLAQEIILSMRNSGLRIKKISFWRSTYDKKSVLDKPIAEFDGHEPS